MFFRTTMVFYSSTITNSDPEVMETTGRYKRITGIYESCDAKPIKRKVRNFKTSIHIHDGDLFLDLTDRYITEKRSKDEDPIITDLENYYTKILIHGTQSTSEPDKALLAHNPGGRGNTVENRADFSTLVDVKIS